MCNYVNLLIEGGFEDIHSVAHPVRRLVGSIAPA